MKHDDTKYKCLSILSQSNMGVQKIPQLQSIQLVAIEYQDPFN